MIAIANVDGGSRKAKRVPGKHAAYGVQIRVWLDDGADCVLQSPDATIDMCEYIGSKTNNEAEFLALIACLRHCTTDGVFQHLTVLSDSMLVVKSMKQEWSLNEDRLFDLWLKATELANKVPSFSIAWVPREENTEADRLVNEALERTFRSWE
jgi:ribonuclease HI